MKVMEIILSGDDDILSKTGWFDLPSLDKDSQPTTGSTDKTGNDNSSGKIVVVGDSIAVGTGGAIPGAVVNAKVGINSSAILDRIDSDKSVKGADVAIICAGTNDGYGVSGKNANSGKTQSNLAAIRKSLGAKKYVWILPFNRNAANDIKAEVGSDTTVDLAGVATPSKDGVHPSSYAPVARACIAAGGVKPGKATAYGDQTGKGVAATGSAKDAVKFFISKGWTKEQAAGIVGNLQAESGANLRTNSVGDGGQAYGIAQWHPDRQALFKRVYKKDIRQAGLPEQLEFVHYELTHDESVAGNKIKQATTAKAAAAAMDQYYERSSGQHRAERIANANNLSGSTYA
jgi:hypothetical protein